MSKKTYLLFFALVFLNIGVLMASVTRITLTRGINSMDAAALLLPPISVMFLIFTVLKIRSDLGYVANIRRDRESAINAITEQQNLNMTLVEEIDRLNDELEQGLKKCQKDQKDQKDKLKQKEEKIEKRAIINAMEEIEI